MEKASPKTRIRPADECSKDSEYGERAVALHLQNLFVEKSFTKTRPRSFHIKTTPKMGSFIYHGH
jgi:hypothetical protein